MVNSIILLGGPESRGRFKFYTSVFVALTLIARDSWYKHLFKTKRVPIESSHTDLSIDTTFTKIGFM